MKSWQTPRPDHVPYPSPARMSINQFLRSLHVSGLVLDLGCGYAQYGSLFPRSRAIRFDLSCRVGVEVVGDAHRLPFRDRSFDTVLALEVLEHLGEPWHAIGEIKRVLRPGGMCVLTTRFCYPLHGAPHDYYRFSEFALRRLFADLEILDLNPDTNALATLMVFGEYASLELEKVHFGGVLTRAAFRALRRLYLVLHARRLSHGRPSRLIPTGYRLVARKPDTEADRQPTKAEAAGPGAETAS